MNRGVQLYKDPETASHLRGGVLAEALSWHSAGFPFVPCYARTKRAKVYWPAWTNRLPSIEQVARWFSDGQSNLALITGGLSELVVLDFDDPGLYRYWLRWSEDQDLEVQLLARDGYRVKTSRGVHVYLRMSGSFPSMKNLIHGLDILAGSGYALTYPSIHPNGHQYVPAGDRKIYTFPSLKVVVPESWLDYSSLRNAYWCCKAKVKGWIAA